MFHDPRIDRRALFGIRTFVLAASALAVFIWPAMAGWLPEGVPVCTAPAYQGSLVTRPDGSGGMLLVWQDMRDAQLKIYAHRIDANGNLLWTTNGVLLSGNQCFHPWICPDGTGGAYIVWNDRAGGYGSIVVQHLNPAGAKLWASAGIVIAAGSGWADNSLPVCTEDGLGGVIVAWVQDAAPPTGDYQVVAQRMGTAGNLKWNAQGIVAGDDIGAGEELDIATDLPSNGAFLGWTNSGGVGIAQRVTLGGVAGWHGTSGESFGIVTPNSRIRVADRDRSSQGAFIMHRWQGGLFNDYNITVTCMDSTTYVFWSETVDGGGHGGTPAPGDDYRVFDGGGGSVMCVWDRLAADGTGKGIFADYLDAINGDSEWGGLVQVSAGTDGNHSPDATVQWGYWNTVVTWVDESLAPPMLKYARVEHTYGTPMNRVTVPGGYSSERPRLVMPFTSGAKPLIAWQDFRLGESDINIYATGLETSGQQTHPNLVATRLVPENPYGTVGGDPHSFFVTVKNLGTSQADSFWTTIFPNQATEPNVGDEPPGTVQSVRCAPLASGDSVVVEILIDAPGSAQTWSMWGFADYRDDVEEFGDEDDNTIGPVSYEWRAFANLEIARVYIANANPYPFQFIAPAVTVKNTGHAAASPVWVDYFYNESSPPPAGSHGEQRYTYFSLAPGDSFVWTTSPTTSTVFMQQSIYFRVDTDDGIEEENENDNLSGPHLVNWQIPPEGGWPEYAGARFHSSPAIAPLDGDPTTLEVVIGCDDGKLYAFDADGNDLDGWPVTIGDTIRSSPAVGDVTGDAHNEVVVGGRDSTLYVFDYTGAKLWEYKADAPVNTTPVLANLNRTGKLEIIFSAGGKLYALTGAGALYPGSWPYAAGAGGTFTSPAVGDVDGTGFDEIAVIAYGYTKPVSSKAFLLKPNGSLYSVSWPATVDTVVSADPVLGDIALPTGDLEIVSGGLNGKVYLWNKNAALWPTLPQVTGSIETSPSLANLNKGDALLEIVVTSRRLVGTFPSHYEGYVTAINNNGTIMSGWPTGSGSWLPNYGPVPSAIITGSTLGRIIAGSPSASVRAWDADGDVLYGFPLDANGPIFTSAAVGNLDGDGWLELVVAGGDSVRCWQLCSSDYPLDALPWPMFRHDRARTGCYGTEVYSGVDEIEEAAPRATAIHSIHPNPFNPTTRIVFDVVTKGRVELAVYDVSGRRIAVLVDRMLDPGRYEATWNGRSLEGGSAASGVYFCRLDAGEASATMKMVLLR